jgi:hypothetical protein
VTWITHAPDRLLLLSGPPDEAPFVQFQESSSNSAAAFCFREDAYLHRQFGFGCSGPAYSGALCITPQVAQGAASSPPKADGPGHSCSINASSRSFAFQAEDDMQDQKANSVKDKLASIRGRLDLALFIDGKNYSVGRRVDIEADDVSHFGRELRVVRKLERADAVRLKPVRAPDTLDVGETHTRNLRIGPHRRRERSRGFWQARTNGSNTAHAFLWVGR